MIGDSTIGRVLARLLRRAGYEPLLVENRHSSVPSRSGYLWPSAVCALRAVDVDVRRLARSSNVEGVSVRTVSEPENPTVLSGATQGEQTTPVVVPRRDLRHALAGPASDQSGRIDRGVETVSRREDGLLVEFDDGIREWFDVVIDAEGSDSAVDRQARPRSGGTLLHQSEVVTEIDDPPGGPNHVHEVQSPDGYVEYIPEPDGAQYRIRRTTRPGETPTASGPAVGGQLGSADEDGPVIEPEDTDATEVRQVRVGDCTVGTDWWGDGRVCRCGTAACAMAPASGCRLSLGIEDALAFVRELTRERRPITDVVDAYAARRVERLRTLQRTAEFARTDHEYPTSHPSDPPVGTVGLLRSVALAPFLGGNLLSAQQAGVR